MSDDRQRLRDLRIKSRLIREELRVKQLEGVKRRVDLRESAEAWEFLDAWSDVIDRMRQPSALYDGYLISTANDRRYGANWPFWRSWQEHARLRAAARILCTMGSQPQGLLGGLCAYVVGPGFKPRAAEKPQAGKVPPGLVAAVQEAMDDFDRENEYPALQQELFTRTHRDGDAFERRFPQDDGMLLVRTVEPEHVVEPVNMDIDTDAFGVRTDPDDLQTVEGFYVAYDGDNGSAELVPVEEMTMFKSNVDRSIKRGLTDFSFDTYDSFRSVARLVENMAEGAAIQASLALIRQHEGSSGSEVEEFVSGAADRTGNDPAAGGRSLSVSRYGPGRIEDIPKGYSYIQPPFMSNAQGAVTVLQAVSRIAGNKWNAPEWLSSGDASNNNYASSLVAESPFVRRCEQRQGYFGPRFRATYEAAVKARCAAGKLRVAGRAWTWEELSRFVTITVEPPRLQTRDTMKEAQEAQAHLEMGTTSRQIICQEAGRDWQQVQRDNAQYERDHPAPQAPPPGAPPGQPSDGPGRGGPPDEGTPSPPQGLTEGVSVDDDGEPVDYQAVADLFYGIYGDKALSVLRKLAERGLTEAWDEAAHPRGKGGKFVKKGSPEAVAKAADVVSRAIGGDASVSPQDVLDHLSILTVKQIQAAAAKHGKTAPKWLRADLIKAVMDVIGTPEEEKPAEEPAEPATEPAPTTEPEAKAETPPAPEPAPSPEPTPEPAPSPEPAPRTGIAAVDAAAAGTPGERAKAAKGALGGLARLMSAGDHKANNAQRHLVNRLVDGASPADRLQMIEAMGLKGFTEKTATEEAVRAVLDDHYAVVLRSLHGRDGGTPAQKRAEAAERGVTLAGLDPSLLTDPGTPTSRIRRPSTGTEPAGDAAEFEGVDRSTAATSGRWTPPKATAAQAKTAAEYADLYRRSSGLTDAEIADAEGRLKALPLADVRQAAAAVGLAFAKAPSKGEAVAAILGRVRKRRGVITRSRMSDRL